MSALALGILRLNDAAPAIWAQEAGLFRAAGLEVELSVEPSWANIADKLAFGRLQAAVLPPPLAMATHLGLRGPARRLMIPMGISLGGNAVTVSNALAAALGGENDTLAIGAKLRGLRPRLAVVHAFSTHNLLLRYWLAASGIDPDHDVQFSVVPPELCVQALADGEIDGFCVGAPWGSVAEARGVGRILLSSQDIWPRHPEKCLTVAQDWADEHPDELNRLLAALLQAAVVCDEPARTQEVAEVLAGPRYLGLPAGWIGGTLPLSSFHRFGANLPRPEHARWLLGQMARWGYVNAAADLQGLYRPDLYREAAGIDVDLPNDDAVLCDGAVV